MNADRYDGTLIARAGVPGLLRDFVRRRLLWLIVAVSILLFLSPIPDTNVAGVYAVFLGLAFMVAESHGESLYVRRTLPISRRQIGFVLWLQTVVLFPVLAALFHTVFNVPGVDWNGSVTFNSLLNMGATASVLIALRVLMWAMDRANVTTVTRVPLAVTAFVAFVGFCYVEAQVLQNAGQITNPALHFGLAFAAVAAITGSLLILDPIGSISFAVAVRPPAVPASQRASLLAHKLARWRERIARLNPFAHWHGPSREIVRAASMSALFFLVILSGVALMDIRSGHYEGSSRSSGFEMPAIIALIGVVQQGARLSARTLRMLPMRRAAVCIWLVAQLLANVLPCLAIFSAVTYALQGNELSTLRVVGFAALLLFTCSAFQVFSYVSQSKLLFALLAGLWALLISLSTETSHDTTSYSLPIGWAVAMACLSIVCHFAVFYYLLGRSSRIYRLSPTVETRSKKQL